MTELRAADLRFTPDEAAQFLNQSMGLALSAEEIAALETRTEGWIAGLQMAALSMQGRADTAGFIQAFTGSHRFVLDYLAEEVLQRQPDPVRRFLLQTAILDRLCGPLCDTVTGRDDGKRMIETLERDDLFVIPLDEQRQWYRYHRLFAEVLQAHSMEKGPEEVLILHRRASEWYEVNDQPVDAIHHALAAADFERVANLAELASLAMHRSHFLSAALLDWLGAIPNELIRARPVLSVGYAWELLNRGELEAADARLRDAEWWLDPMSDLMSDAPTLLPAGTSAEAEAPAPEMVVIDEEEYRSLPAEVASARSYYALALGDVPGTIGYARQALELFAEDDYIRRGPAASILGLAYWTTGDLEDAYQALAHGMANFRMVGHMAFALAGTYGLADIRIAQGRLHDAIRTYEQALQLALSAANEAGVLTTEQGEPVIQGTTELYWGLSELYREQGNMQAATAHLQSSEALGKQAALSTLPYRMCLAQARTKKAQGDLDGALDLLDEAARLYVRGPVPDVRPIAALKAAVWIAQGRMAEALGWARSRGLAVEDNLSYLREFEHMTLARILIAQSKSNRETQTIYDAIRLLERLLQAAEAGERMGSVIEILLLQAFAHKAHDDMPGALAALERALTLAEPEGYVQLFVDEGPPMAILLQAAAEQDIAPGYVRRLLAAFGQGEDKAPATQQLLTEQTPTTAAPVPAIEPLSERELDVLRLLRTELSGPEIARELMISLNTMRTHSKNIYSKIGVNSRQAAVRRAAELTLL